MNTPARATAVPETSKNMKNQGKLYGAIMSSHKITNVNEFSSISQNNNEFCN